MFSRLKKELKGIENNDVLLSAIISFVCFFIMAIAIVICFISQCL